MVSNTTTVTI